jgi:hypothetical protein
MERRRVLCGLVAVLVAASGCRPGSIDSDSSSNGDSNSTDDPGACGSGVPKSGKYCFERVVVPDIQFVEAATAYPLGADATGLVVAHGPDDRLSLIGFDEGTPRLRDQIALGFVKHSSVWSSRLDVDSFTDIVGVSPLARYPRRAELVRRRRGALDDAPVVHGVALVDANGDGIAEIVAGGTNHGTLMWAADRTV